VHEVIRATGIALSNKPARYQFRFGVQRRPRPNVARPLAFVSALQFFSFAPTKLQISSH